MVGAALNDWLTNCGWPTTTGTDNTTQSRQGNQMKMFALALNEQWLMAPMLFLLLMMLVLHLLGATGNHAQ